MAQTLVNTVRIETSPPPQTPAGDVPELPQVTAKILLNAKGMWVARPDVPAEKELIDMRDDLCRRMGIRDVPKLFIYESEKPNAAASMLGNNIMFSTDLLKIMSHDQVKAVMGHELTHQQKKSKSWAALGFEIVTVTAASVFSRNAIEKLNPAKAVNRLAKALARSATVRFLAQLSGLLAIQGWFQRRFEKEADLGGAKVAGSDAMIGALSALETRSKEIKAEEEKEGKIDWKKYTINLPIFRTHPKTEKRIENIIANGPKTFTGQYEAANDMPQAPVINR